MVIKLKVLSVCNQIAKKVKFIIYANLGVALSEKMPLEFFGRETPVVRRIAWGRDFANMKVGAEKFRHFGHLFLIRYDYY